MSIEITPKVFEKQTVKMGRLKSGCSCWSNAWFNG